MLDTIETLEAIGCNASLRHASTTELTNVLAKMDASPALTAAVASGDSTELFAELGCKVMWAPQVAQHFG
jgi:hypothetical protein